MKCTAVATCHWSQRPHQAVQRRHGTFCHGEENGEQKGGKYLEEDDIFFLRRRRKRRRTWIFFWRRRKIANEKKESIRRRKIFGTERKRRAEKENLLEKPSHDACQTDTHTNGIVEIELEFFTQILRQSQAKTITRTSGMNVVFHCCKIDTKNVNSGTFLQRNAPLFLCFV